MTTNGVRGLPPTRDSMCYALDAVAAPDGSERSLMAERRRMLEEQLVARNIRDERVLDAMARIERHRFVPDSRLDAAYGDFPVCIGCGQTLSQPYIVALMTEALALRGEERVLEVGTGSGYQTAVLAELAREVFTVEVVPDLARSARERLDALGYENIYFRIGDGKLGWFEQAPFDAILVAAAPEGVPSALKQQLASGGRLVIPVGPPEMQELELYVREEEEFRVQRLGAVRFVPLV